MSGVSDWVASQWLSIFTGDGIYLALCVTDPDRSGLTNSEVVGGSYTRQPATFVHYDIRTVWLSEQVDWGGLPQCTISHIAVCNRFRNGQLLSSSLLPPPAPQVDFGSDFSLDAFTYAITVGVPS